MARRTGIEVLGVWSGGEGLRPPGRGRGWRGAPRLWLRWLEGCGRRRHRRERWHRSLWGQGEEGMRGRRAPRGRSCVAELCSDLCPVLRLPELQRSKDKRADNDDDPDMCALHLLSSSPLGAEL